METRWIAEIRNTPTPAESSLTERALRETAPSKRTSLRFYALGGLALAATIPVALILSPKKATPVPETVKLAFVKATSTRAILNPTPAIQTTTPAIKNPTRANRIPTRAKAIPSAKETQVALEIGKETENFGFRLPAIQESVHEKPLLLQRTGLAALQESPPTVETVKLLKVAAQEATADSLPMLGADPALAGLEAEKELLELRLRYPLSPLPKAPQATVKKAELFQHADSGEVYGTVALAPEETVRELLVAVFDQKGALVAVKKELLPAKSEAVEIRSFHAPLGVARYQLGLRPRFEREKSKLEIIGGYRGYEKHVEVPAPPGVEIGVGDADFYQSNVHQDHFVRFSATLSKEILKQPFGDPELTLHGIVLDEKGALLSVASERIENKPEAQRLDLGFGLLPEGVTYRYKFVVTSRYRLAFDTTEAKKKPDASFTVASATKETDGSLILMPKQKDFPWADVLKKPELRDYTQIKMTPNVVKELKARGITEFVGLSVEASGKSERVLYTGFPSTEVTTVTVKKIEDIAFPSVELERL